MSGVDEQSVEICPMCSRYVLTWHLHTGIIEQIGWYDVRDGEGKYGRDRTIFFQKINGKPVSTGHVDDSPFDYSDIKWIVCPDECCYSKFGVGTRIFESVMMLVKEAQQGFKR